MRIKFLFLFFFSLVVVPCDIKAQNIRHTIYFNSGSHELSSPDKEVLKKIVDSLIAAKEKYSITLSGNTDNQGSDQFNHKLSGQRADVVKDFLIVAGFSNDIQLQSNGEIFPIATNETGEGRKLNRRVELSITQLSFSDAFEKYIEPVKVEEGNIADLYALLKTPPQEYCIDVTRDTFLIGKKGTIIHYKANTIKRDNLSCRCFTLHLNEYFDKDELIFNNLTTTSDGRPLESGGMVKLDGYCDGKKYELKPGEFFTVMVPTDTILPGMKLLSANRNNDAEYLNWKFDPVNDSLDYFDWYKMWLHCGRGTGKVGPPGHCSFFFCKIGRFFSGMFERGALKRNRTNKNNQLSENEEMIMQKYELKGEDLATTLERSKDNAKDNAGKNALKYYVYKNSNWDYRNIDRYTKGLRFTNFIVENKPTQEMDVKIIYKFSKTAVPSFERSSSYVFKDVNDETDIWVVGLRYTAKKEIYLGLKESNTDKKRTSLEFRQVTVEELKQEMKKVK